MGEFRESSLTLTKDLTKLVRQEQGIYFTPKSIRQILFKNIPIVPTTILEPSFGSGEFILDSREMWPRAQIYGVEKNNEFFRSMTCPDIQTYEGDFLTWSGPTKFDLIIGNPPYFVTKLKDPRCMTGRGNVFVMFLYKCLTEHVAPGGYIAFVLPTSFYNSKYYEPCRKYMAENVTITHVQNLSGGFMDTAQDTMALIIKNEKPGPSRPYFVFGTSISPHWKEIDAIVKNAATLRDLGWGVRTGDVVWNEHKAKLRNDEGTLVIYTTNIVDGNLVLGNLKGEAKGQYIQDFQGTPTRGPAFLVSRGYGNRYKFSWTFVPIEEFWAENHLNVIRPNNQEAIQWTDRIKRSFRDPRTELFIKYYFGNGSISKTELETIFPIF